MPTQLEDLIARSQAVSLCGHNLVVKTVPDLQGAVGRFFEPKAGRNVEPRIGLKADRPVLETWLTLAHELGHYTSWATAQRPSSFPAVEDKYAMRMWNLSCHIQNAASGRDRKDPTVYGPLLEAARSAFPQDLSEEERREVLAEECRAWCFAAELAQASAFDVQLVVDEANKALGYYCINLELPFVPWAPASCAPLGTEGREFLRALAC